MRRALSIVELLTTLFVMAVVITISVGVYQNIQKNAENVVKASDQRAFLKALDSFCATGGDITMITRNDDLTGDFQKGQAMLEAVKGLATSSDRTTRGIVSDLVANNLVVVEKRDSDNTPRLVIDGAGVKLANTGSGFLVVPAASVTSPQAVPAGVIAVAQAAQNTTASGARYAANKQYLWNEDDSVSGGPATGAMGVSASTTPPSVTMVKVPLAFAYNDSNSGSFAFNYGEYIDSNSFVDVFVYAQNFSPLAVSDLASVVLAIDGAAVGAHAAANCRVDGSGKIVTSGGTPVDGVLIRIANLNANLRAATSWSSTTAALAVSATPSVSGAGKGFESGNKGWTLTAVPTPLNPPDITGANDFKAAGKKIEVNALSANPGRPVKLDGLNFDDSTLTGTTQAPALPTTSVTYTRTI